MGMSTDMSPRYLSVNPSGQMTYVVDAGSLNLGGVQLAVPASDILLVQDDNKSLNLCDGSVLVAADLSSENVSWLGNNIILLVSQPQEFVVVEQEIMVDSNVGQPWAVETALVTKEASKEDGDEPSEEVSTTTVEDAKNWFRDSLISTAALSTLTTYVHAKQSNAPSSRLG